MENDLDKKLYKDYLDGEKQAFELIYNKYKSKIEYFIFNIVKDYQKAEDLTQETFIYVMQNTRKIEGSFKYYIYLVARSKAFNYINIENRRNEIAQEYLSKDEQIEKDVLEVITQEETKKELLESIELLDDDYKNAIYLTKIEKMSYKETAEILGESVQNVKNRVHRGKRQLRKILLKKGFDNMNKVSKVILLILCISILTTGIGYCAYQFINNVLLKPRDNIFGIEFSEDYDKYNVKYNELSTTDNCNPYKENDVKLISSYLDEAFLTLEFEVNINEDTYKELRIGESVLTDKDIENMKYQREEYEIVETEEEKDRRIEELLKRTSKNTVKLILNLNDTYKNGMGCDSLIIDEQEYYMTGTLVESNELNKYSYQVYVIYPIMRNNKLKNKEHFSLTLNNIAISNGADITQSLKSEDNSYLITGSDNFKYIQCDKNFEINLSKDALKKETRIIKNKDYKSILRNYIKTIEEIDVSPVETIIKMNTEISNVSSKTLSSAFEKDENKFGIMYYEVHDQDGNEINPYICEVKRHVKYKNGKEEDWAPNDIEVFKNFSGATFYLQDYIVFRRNENVKSVTIKPYRTLDSSHNKNREYFDDVVIELE